MLWNRELIAGYIEKESMSLSPSKKEEQSTRSMFHKKCFQQRPEESDFFKSPKRNVDKNSASAKCGEDGNRSAQGDHQKPSGSISNASMALPSKVRDLEAQLNVVISEFKKKVEQYDKCIAKIHKDFDVERKLLNARICDEQEKARQTEAQLIDHHSTIVSELNGQIVQLQLENKLKDNEIFQLQRISKQANDEIRTLENKLRQKQGFAGIENLRAQQMFSLLDKYIRENGDAWSEVERICEKSNVSKLH